jgi:hypothetical protein
MSPVLKLNYQDFLRALLVLLDLHGREMSVEAQMAFFEEVEDLPADLVLAVMRELRRSEWMPKPADVIERVKVRQREQRRALVEADKQKALPEGQMSEQEQEQMLQGMRDLVAQLSSRMTGSSPAGRHTPATAEAEVRSLKEAEQADLGHQQRRQAAAARVRAQGVDGHDA